MLCSEGGSFDSFTRIDWDLARKTDLLGAFTTEIRARLAPLLHNSYDEAHQIDREMRHVAWLLVDAVEKTLPHVQPSRMAR